LQALRRHQRLASWFIEHAAYVVLKPGRLKDRIVYDIYFLVKLLDVGFYLLFFFDHCASSFLRGISAFFMARYYVEQFMV
jgi:hypothetical protein